MRHSNSGKKLGRTPSHRKALFRNMASAMITYGKIRTTEVKAKELRRVVEPWPFATICTPAVWPMKP